MTELYTGHVETITVPAHVVGTVVSVSGAQGYPGDGYAEQGWGATIDGTLSVQGGDVLTVAAGGQGQPNNGNKNPGVGGWSIAPYEGGRGGSGHGSQTADGSGGGGASVIQRNGTTVVVAAGGGGRGGHATHLDGWNGGGSAGTTIGSDGVGGKGAGKGGSGLLPSLDKAGGSSDGKHLQGGGGGGGGGRYPGGGGQAQQEIPIVGPTNGGAGGGGGASLYDALTKVTTHVGKGKDLHGPSHEGNAGNGRVTITWQYEPDSRTVFAFAKAGSPTEMLIEVNGDHNTTPGGTVDTWSAVRDASQQLQRNQLWTHVYRGRTQSGQLVNLDSDLCLEVNGTSGSVDQWPCVDGAPNQLWQIASDSGGTVLRVELGDGDTTFAAGTYCLATTSASTEIHNGTRLAMLTSGTDDRCRWQQTAQKR